jgi:hypothetical protein
MGVVLFEGDVDITSRGLVDMSNALRILKTPRRPPTGRGGPGSPVRMPTTSSFTEDTLYSEHVLRP